MTGESSSTRVEWLGVTTNTRQKCVHGHSAHNLLVPRSPQFSFTLGPHSSCGCHRNEWLPLPVTPLSFHPRAQRNKIQRNKILTGFVCRFFAQFNRCTGNRWCRWTPISIRVVMKWILLLIMPRLKQRCFRPKMAPEAIQEHQIFINFSWGSMPPDPTSLIPSIPLQVWVQKPGQCNFASSGPDM